MDCSVWPAPTKSQPSWSFALTFRSPTAKDVTAVTVFLPLEFFDADGLVVQRMMDTKARLGVLPSFLGQALDRS